MKQKFLTVLLVLSLGLFAANILFVSAEDSNAQSGQTGVQNLFAEYYGNGDYIKSTKIYVDADVIGPELLEHFHSGIPTLERTTYYSGNELLMSNGNGYSGYGTKTVDGVDYLTSFKVSSDLVRGNESSTGILGGMEGYYCTLYDFKEGVHSSDHVFNDSKTIDLTKGWTYLNGVYTSTDEDVLEGYRLFTAPLWLGKTKTNENFIIYTKATVEEVDNKLVLSLYVSSGDYGKLETNEPLVDGESYLFSQAVISKPLVQNEISVNGVTWEQNTTYPVSAYDVINGTIVFNSNNNCIGGASDAALRQNGVLYLSDVQTGSFELSYKVDVSQATIANAQRTGFTITDGTNTIRISNFWSGVNVIANNNNAAFERNQNNRDGNFKLGLMHWSNDPASYDQAMIKVFFDKVNKEMTIYYAPIIDGVASEYVVLAKFTTTGIYRADGAKFEWSANHYDLYELRLEQIMSSNEVAIGFSNYAQGPNTIYSDISLIRK